MQDRKTVNPEEKNKRLAVALTVALTLMLLFVAIILIIQCVKLGVAKSESRRLDEEIEKYEKMLEDGKAELDNYSTELTQLRLALQYGFRFKTDDK